MSSATARLGAPLTQVTDTRLAARYRQLEKSGRKDYRAGEGTVGAHCSRPDPPVLHGPLRRVDPQDRR
jgi:hypothetical protein